ncbi:hypothetical protein PENTCL1PPCAC_7488, partial [Pristionchus entomophagus]
KMTDVMRDMINQLMGAQRAEEEGRNLPPYDHHTVCRAYLYGCCPADILVDTRLDSLVLCRKLHEAALKGQYEREQEKKDHFYDIETFDTLGMAIRAVDVDINKIKDKLERDNKEHADSVEYVKAQKIHDLNEQIGKALAKMEELGNEGKVEESMQLSQTVEELKTKKEQLHTDLRMVGSINQRQQLRVCDDCGAQLNLLDHETRLADHFGGKMHLGMVDIRAKYDEMKPTIDERKRLRLEAGAGGGGGSSFGGGGGDRRDRDR